MDTPEEKSHPQNECFNFTEIGVVENGVENYVSHVNAFNATGAEKALTGNDLLWLTFCQKQSIHTIRYRIKYFKNLKHGTELQYHPCNTDASGLLCFAEEECGKKYWRGSL